jgi:hypothetical protein
VRDVADGDAGVFVDGAGLVGGEDGEGFDLSVIEVCVAAEGGEVDGWGGIVDAVEFGEGEDGGAPPVEAERLVGGRQQIGK